MHIVDSRWISEELSVRLLEFQLIMGIYSEIT